KFVERSDPAGEQPSALERLEEKRFSLQVPELLAGVVAVPAADRDRAGALGKNVAAKALDGRAPGADGARFGVRDPRRCAARARRRAARDVQPWAQIGELRGAEFLEALRTVLDELEEDRQHAHVVEMMPRDIDQVELKVPYPRAVAERLF